MTTTAVHHRIVQRGKRQAVVIAASTCSGAVLGPTDRSYCAHPSGAGSAPPVRTTYTAFVSPRISIDPCSLTLFPLACGDRDCFSNLSTSLFNPSLLCGIHHSTMKPAPHKAEVHRADVCQGQFNVCQKGGWLY